MKTIYLILTTIFIATMLGSCDIIDGNPYEIKDPENPEDPVSVDTVKKVLLIEFTGQKCVNCPAAHAQIDALHENYGSRFIPVAIHAGAYAKPSSEYPNDYRTPFGNSFHDYILPNGYPTGLVGSILSSNQSSETSWAEQVDELLKVPTSLSLIIEKATVSDSIKANVKIKNVMPEIVFNELKFYALLVEDSVVGKQLTPTGIVDKYVHNHMLRHGFTSYLGDDFTLNNQNEFEIKMSVAINDKWRQNKLMLIVFVVENDDVLQANYKKIEL